MAMEAMMPKALARSEVMTRGNIETVEDSGSVVNSKAGNQQVDNLQVVVVTMVDQGRNLTSSLHHVIQVVPEGEVAAVQVELTRYLQAVTPGLQTVTLLQEIQTEVMMMMMERAAAPKGQDLMYLTRLIRPGSA